MFNQLEECISTPEAFKIGRGLKSTSYQDKPLLKVSYSIFFFFKKVILNIIIIKIEFCYDCKNNH